MSVRLSADLYANTSKFESGMKRASSILGRFSSNIDKSMGRSGRSFDKFNRKAGRTNNVFTGLIRNSGLLSAAIGGIAGAVTIRSFTNISDSLVNINTRLGNVTDSADDFADKYEKIFNVSQKLGTSFESNIDAFVKLNTSLPDAVRNTRDLTAATELLSRGFAASGTDAGAQRGALIQLTQGLAGNFQNAAQEINSLIEAAPLLAKTIAEQLGGKSAVDLKKFAQEGKLTTETFLDALEASRGAIEAFEIPPTIQRSLTKLRNEFIRLANESDTFKNAGGNLAGAISLLADNLGLLSKAIVGVAVVLTGRLTAALVANTAAFVAATAQSIAYQATLARMAGVSGLAAAATTALSAAVGLLRGALTLLGGPIGLVVTGVASVVLFGDEILNAAKKLPILGGAIDDVFSGAGLIIAGIANVFKKFIADIEIQLFKLTDKFAQTKLGKQLGIEVNAPSLGALRRSQQTVGQAFEEGFEGKLLERQLEKLDIQKEINSLKKEETKIAEQNLEVVDEQKEAAKDLERAYDSVGLAIGTAFEDAVIGGQKLGDVLRGLADDIQRIILRQAVTKPLEGAIGGLLSGFDFGNIFGGSIGSNATGSAYVPRDMMTRVHKGEAIIPAQQAAKMRQGGNAGYTVNIDARGAEAGVENKIRAVMNEVMALRKEVPAIAVNSVSSANKRNPRLLNG